MVSFGALRPAKRNGSYPFDTPPYESWPKRVGTWTAATLGVLGIVTALYKFGVLGVPFVTVVQAKAIVHEETDASFANINSKLDEQHEMLQVIINMHMRGN